MASAFSVNTPPSFNRSTDNYTKWRKKFDIWQGVTDVEKTKQGGSMMTLKILYLRLSKQKNSKQTMELIIC